MRENSTRLTESLQINMQPHTKLYFFPKQLRSPSTIPRFNVLLHEEGLSYVQVTTQHQELLPSQRVSGGPASGALQRAHPE